jgi:hypothetical protein
VHGPRSPPPCRIEPSILAENDCVAYWARALGGGDLARRRKDDPYKTVDTFAVEHDGNRERLGDRSVLEHRDRSLPRFSGVSSIATATTRLHVRLKSHRAHSLAAVKQSKHYRSLLRCRMVPRQPLAWLLNSSEHLTEPAFGEP